METGLNISEALIVATEAAKCGGRIIRQQFGWATQVTMKGDIEEQIPVDIESEKVIIEIIGRHFPGHSIHSEEMGARDRASSQYTWIIDPLDGTSNFILGIPQVAVCVSLVRDNETQLTVIYQPILDSIYSAILGGGAYLNEKKIQVHQKATSLSSSTVCRVLAYGMQKHKLTKLVTNKLYGNTRRVLDTWAPSLDWCMLASGKIDGLVYVSNHLLRLDPGMLAGLFIFQEAGGCIGDFRGEIIDNVTQIESVVAATSHPMLEEICRTISSEEL